MQEKNKKTILEITIIAAITLTATSFFIPITSIDYSDVLEEYDVENPEWYWTVEHAVLYAHRTEYYFGENTNEKPSEYHLYMILHSFFEIEIGESSAVRITEYNKEETSLISRTMISMIGLVITFLMSILFIYLCYNGIKYRFVKKNRYFLYLGIICLSVIFILFIAAYYMVDFADVDKLGYTNFITISYGLYTFIISSILFFIAYLIQNHFLNLKTEGKNANK